MNDIGSWILGTIFLWVVNFICVNPLAVYIATYRLMRTRAPVYGQKIEPESIPDRYFMFSGALVFTVLGFLIGSVFGTYFIGLSWEKKYLPGVATLILASLAGSFSNVTLLIFALLISIATGAAVVLQKPEILRWKEEVSVPPPTPALTCPYCRASITPEAEYCPSCGKKVR